MLHQIRQEIRMFFSQSVAQLIYLDCAILQHDFIRNLLLEVKLFFPEDLRLNFNCYFDDNKFPFEIKSFSYSNIKYNRKNQLRYSHLRDCLNSSYKGIRPAIKMNKFTYCLEISRREKLNFLYTLKPNAYYNLSFKQCLSEHFFSYVLFSRCLS